MQTEDYKIVWEKCLSIVKDIITPKQYETWFLKAKPLSLVGDVFTLWVPTEYFSQHVEVQFGSLLLQTLQRICKREIRIVTTWKVIKDEADTEVKTPIGKPDVPTKPINPFVPIQIAPQDWDPHLSSRYSFDNYYEGTSNKLGRSIGEAVAQNPGKTAYNPMFLYGPSGVGKTHLCHAIGARIRELHPEKRVLYVSTHLFCAQYTDAVRKNQVNDFLTFYQTVDVLLLDDIQELIGKDKTQNIFFHIFNHLHLNGKQLILTSDQAPAVMQGFEERVITRLKWGLTAELNRPDLDLRKKILGDKIDHEGIVIPNDVFEFIADNVTDNVRDLEGVLASLMANAVVMNREIDLSLAKRVISQAVRLEKKQLSVQMIMDMVCNYYNLEQSLIQKSSRKREIVQARQVTMYLAKKYTDCSFSHIGKIVGKKDHATVLHACKTIRDQMETDKSFRSSVEEIEVKLKS